MSNFYTNKPCGEIILPDAKTIQRIQRDIKLDIILGKYKATSAYKLTENPINWLECPNCGLKPLTWTFNNGSSTACGCGENEYRHFSIHSESIMSYVTRNNGSALNYNSHQLMINWNHWVRTGIELETFDQLRLEGKW